MPWFLFLLASVAIAAHAWRRAGQSARTKLSVVLTAACWLLAFLFWPGRFYAEKMLTELALPLGLVWFGMLASAVAFASRGGHRFAALIFASLCGLLSLAGLPATGDSLIRSLERPYLDDEPLQAAPFDAIAVLGGGAWVDVKGQPTLSSAGDRIVLAARLFDAGKTPRLICTGDDLQPAPNLPTVAMMSKAVLIQLDVPEQAITTAGGDTTKSELAALRLLISEREWKRVGLITSAWHMPRVERLARGTGVEFVPLAADFRSSAEEHLPLWEKVRRFSLIPRAGAVQRTHDAVKEYLAVLAGR